MSITLQLPKLTDLRPRLTVAGVGGAGCNAVNNMIAAGLTGVEFIVANTDAQALLASSAEHRLQLGVNLTEGLGAGSKPEIGEAAAEEAVDEIRAQISGSHMLFIAAGMGGGTGTGACSVIARVARDLGILTVGVVTKPFMFEGTRRQRTAEAGIAELRKHVDTLIVIPNQNLFRIANAKTTFAEAFVLADQVLYSGIACIVDLIMKDGLINLDFADVRTVLKDMGAAMMGTGEAVGEDRARLAAEEAIANPLLDDVTLKGARGLLLSITGSHDMTLYEVDEAASRVRQEIDGDANIIVGATFDDALGDAIRVSIVASGMERAELAEKGPPPAPEAWPNTRLVPPPPPPAAPGQSTQAFEDRLSEAMALARAKEGSAAPHAEKDRLPQDPHAVAARPPSDQHTHQRPAPSSPPGRETWQAPGNVVIERGYQPPPSGALPPSPTAPQPVQSATFRPQAPLEVRRPPARRMPEVDEFPIVGQRAYHAGAAAPPNSPSDGRMQQPVHSDSRKPGLLAQITGRHRKPSDLYSEVPQQGERDIARKSTTSSSHPGKTTITDGHGTLGAAVSPEQPVELPMVYGRTRR